MKSGECDAVLIKGATVSTLAYKWYRKWDGRAKISGAAFGSNGEIWQENSVTKLKFVVSIDPVAVRRTPAGIREVKIPKLPRLELKDGFRRFFVPGNLMKRGPSGGQ